MTKALTTETADSQQEAGEAKHFDGLMVAPGTVLDRRWFDENDVDCLSTQSTTPEASKRAQ